jgi:hypothetical protein
LYGFINGITQGLTNGGSKTKGKTNGFVNGSGAVNGFRLSYQQRRIAGARVDLAKKLVVIVILVAIVVTIPYALVYAFPRTTIQIDGCFTDWLRAQVYKEAPDSSNPDIALTAYAMKYDSRGSFFYIATEGQILEGRDNGADGFYIFIDRDNNPMSGYSVRALGADALVTVLGWNKSVIAADSYAFDPTATRLDFSGFKSVSVANAALHGGEMEIGSSIIVGENSRVAICARHTNISNDWSDVNFRTKGSALEATEDFNMPSVLSIAPNQRVLTINITAKGPQASVQGFRFEFLGNTTPVSISAVEGDKVLGTSDHESLQFDMPLLVGDKNRSIDIVATLSASCSEESFGIQLNETDAIKVDRNVTWVVHSVQTGSKVAYIGDSPSKIAIDGAFGDWIPRIPILDRLNDAYSSRTKDNTSGDVDISVVKVASSLDTVSFYMSVNGTMLGGSSVPASMVRFVVPGPPAQNVTNITEHMFGADFAFVFIDSDHNPSTGYYVGGSEISIAVIGKGNSILSSMAYRYVRGGWAEIGLVQAAIDSYQLELSSTYATLGLVPNDTYAITMLAQDWSSRQDQIAFPLSARLAAMRAFGGIVINEIYSDRGRVDWLELYNTGPAPINIGGWRLYLGGSPPPGGNGRLVYTFPSVTVQPGGFYVLTGMGFGRDTQYWLTDASGNWVDNVTTPAWRQVSYGRVGNAPYSSWATMTPTPGAINQNQKPIPEFEHLVLPIAIVPLLLIAIRRARRPGESRDG